MPQKNLDVVKEDNGSGREQLLRLLGSWRNRRRNTGRKQLAATALLSSENSSCVEKEHKERGFGPAALPSRPEAPRDPKGRGEARGVGAGGRARPLRGPPARGLTGTPHPPAPHPYPGPRRPRRSPRSGPGWTPGRRPAVVARGRPPGPRVPSLLHPGAGPLTLSFSARGLARAGESPASHQSERRWQWTRKLGCRCYCSPLGSGESLSLSSKRAKKAGLPGLHKKRQQPPTAPLQALRGHNTREPLLCPPKRQLSYHLGGRAKGGQGEKCTRSR
ncbi:hypothetical protein AB1E18_001252 [Capra hircus]